MHIVLARIGLRICAYEFSSRGLVCAGQRFARKLDVFSGDRFCLRDGRQLFVAMPMIIIFEIFENIADVQEGVAVQADIHECRLHTGQNAGNSAFIDAADKREFFFALDINFY